MSPRPACGHPPRAPAAPATARLGRLLLALCALGSCARGAAAARNGLITYATNTTGSWQIWAVEPDCSSPPRQLTSPAGGVALAAHPAWSPDGALLAFTCQDAAGAFNVCVAAANGTAARRVTNYSAPHYAMVPAFTADGASLVFESNAHVPAANSTASDPTEIFSVPLAGGAPAQLTFTPGGRSSMGAKPSPDGRALAFATDRGDRQTLGLFDLWVSDADGASPRRLTRGAANQFSRAWSPDGGRIAFNSQKRWARDKVGAGRIMVMKADGRGRRALTKANGRFPAFAPGPPFPTLRGDVTPAWSPDGGRIAFASQRAPGGNFEVVSVRSDNGRDLRQLTAAAGTPHITVGWQPLP
ncbi:MAG: hypothetical protein J3K34DRAFT_433990 [Monoraphidium minutum]|nr:MAG: hypothetical protein J3K34DRAFT_433990 [Monoraphidium minutum]